MSDADRKRQACPACAGGGSFAHGINGMGGSRMCVSCGGSGIECDADYVIRLRSLPGFKPAVHAA